MVRGSARLCPAGRGLPRSSGGVADDQGDGVSVPRDGCSLVVRSLAEFVNLGQGHLKRSWSPRRVRDRLLNALFRCCLAG